MKTHKLYQSVVSMICIGFFLSNSLSAQEISEEQWIAYDSTDLKFSCYPSWKKGQIIKCVAKYEEFYFENDSLTSKNDKVNAVVSFEVIDSVTDGYIFEYRLLENRKTNEVINEKAIETLQNIALKMSESEFAIKYKVDLGGSLQEYLNYEEVIHNLDELTKEMALIKVIRQEGESQKSFKDRQERYNILWNGSTFFENLFANYIYNFHFLYGFEMGVNDTLNYKESYPNEILKKTIKSDNYLFISSLDSVANEVSFLTEKYFNPDVIKNIAEKSLKNELTRNEIKGLYAERFIKHKYSFNFNTGLTSYLSILNEFQLFDEQTAIKTTKHKIWTLSNELKE